MTSTPTGDRPAAPCGITSTLLAAGTCDTGITARVGGRAEVTVQEVTLAPGASTDWHYHPGPLIVVVRSGTLTRTLHDRTRLTQAAGSAFVEPAGPHRVHLGSNLGTDPVVLLITYVLPVGSPLARPVPCPFPGPGWR
ncbi:cupin domain-containing protein [Kitasatospora sp. NBC_01539]|uniref:cupin domain-containing protein n=1 Tax=Kitasatospora sp. NBC_01539 TaxID=2903577 RepID=UPI0038601C07